MKNDYKKILSFLKYLGIQIDIPGNNFATRILIQKIVYIFKHLGLQFSNYDDYNFYMKGIYSPNLTLDYYNSHSECEILPSTTPLNSEISRIFSDAETAEFIEKNYPGAIDSYKKAFTHAISPLEKALILSRIGRSYYKSGKYERGIKQYRNILELGNGELTIGKVPASIVALTQIADGYEKLGSLQNRNSIIIQTSRKSLKTGIFFGHFSYW